MLALQRQCLRDFPSGRQQFEQHPRAGEGVVEGVVAVDTVDAQFLDQGGEPVVREVLAQPPRKRERVARVDALAGEAEVELGAFHAEHAQVERRVVGDQERVLAEKVEELAHRLLRRDAVFA